MCALHSCIRKSGECGETTKTKKMSLLIKMYASPVEMQVTAGASTELEGRE
jgi:hypothetical protein